MQKKRYQTPTITRVKLIVKNSILSVCHSSPQMTPGPPITEACTMVTTCFQTSP
jgi:hypothetical protein